MTEDDYKDWYFDLTIATRGDMPQRLVTYPGPAAGTTLKQMHDGRHMQLKQPPKSSANQMQLFLHTCRV